MVDYLNVVSPLAVNGPSLVKSSINLIGHFGQLIRQCNVMSIASFTE